MTTALCPAIPSFQSADTSGAIRGASARWAVRFWRGLVFYLLFSIIFLPEFLRDDYGADASFVYDKVAAGFRMVDVALLALVLVHLIAVACTRRRVLHFPRALAIPGVGFLTCIASGVCYGHMRGGTNFFFDWRALALGIGLYFVWAFWIQSSADLHTAVRLFAIYMAVRIVILYALYLSGHSATLLGVPIPTFDGPALSAIVFAALMALRYYENAGNRRQKFLWMGLSTAAYLIVLLCFRRTYWLELAIGTVILLLLQRHSRLRVCILVGAMICLSAAILGEHFSARLQSFNFAHTDGEFSADNSDHWFDLLDAWDQVRQSPVMGIGVGTAYSTWRIRNWKNESVMVHNAPIHVWLKYGVAGLGCYLWFHMAALRWLYKRSKYLPGEAAVFSCAAFAYLTAQFLVTLGFAPWPYSELQMTILISFVLTAAFATSRLRPATTSWQCK